MVIRQDLIGRQSIGEFYPRKQITHFLRMENGDPALFCLLQHLEVKPNPMKLVARQGQEEAQRRRRKGVRKLEEEAPLTNAVTHAILQRKWSPEQVAERLRVDYPEDKQWHVSHETI